MFYQEGFGFLFNLTTRNRIYPTCQIEAPLRYLAKFFVFNNKKPPLTNAKGGLLKN